MNKIVVILLSLISGISLNAQVKSELEGEWRLIEVKNIVTVDSAFLLDDDQNEKLEIVDYSYYVEEIVSEKIWRFTESEIQIREKQNLGLPNYVNKEYEIREVGIKLVLEDRWFEIEKLSNKNLELKEVKDREIIKILKFRREI